MMNEMNKTDQINERMIEDQIDSLRGLGGVRSVVSYVDIVLNVHSAIKDLCDENKCEYGTNLSLFLEGLEEDVSELENGTEVRHLPIRPKTTDDVE
jgi:hypothetical protein